MIIKDIYLLERSEEFNVAHREEVTVNLSLRREPVKPKTIIKGKVIDKCNNCIEGAIVKIFTLKYKPIEHVTTNSCGKFLFKDIILPGMYYVIATAPAYKVSKAYSIIVLPNSVTNLIITLDKEDCSLGVLYGHVRDGAGKGIDNAVVKLFSYNNPENIEAITHTNNDGEYLIYGLNSGKYFIISEKPGYMFSSKVSLIIEENEFTKLDLFLYEITSHRKGTISGQITSQCQEVPYAFVALYKLDNDNNSTLIKIKRCNEDGVYLFEDIDPGSYVVKSKDTERMVYL